VADRLLGQRRAVLVGGVVIMAGHVCLAFHGLAPFYAGLACVIVGTGLLKPNMSAMVGQLYPPGDARRDAGFSIYYMGINTGAFLAPLVCGFLAQDSWFKSRLASFGVDPRESWHFGFGAAAVGMFLGLVQYVLGGRRLGSVGLRTAGEERHSPLLSRRAGVTVVAAAALLVLAGAASAVGLLDVTVERINALLGAVLVGTPVAYFATLLVAGGFDVVERRRLAVVAILFVFSAIFFAAFEQGGGTLNLFADRSTRASVFGYEFPSSWFQFVNPIFIIALSPVFAGIWVRLARAGLVSAEGKIPFWTLVAVYVIQSVGELCLSPIGLSMVTKLAPERAAGRIMGIWFLGNALANFLAGESVVLTEHLSQVQLFTGIALVSLGAGVILAFLIGPVRSMMGGVK
jgi:proton-dependent oligopeptide transporter, POT family